MKNPLSLEAFADWLGQQEPSARYSYVNPLNCALCQYLRFVGLPVYSVAGNYWRDTDTRARHVFDDRMNQAVLGTKTDYAQTFGDACRRARELLAA